MAELRIGFEIVPTPDHGLPWELAPDEHGVITTEVIECYLGSGFYYDIPASISKALAEGWKIEQRLIGPNTTAEQIAQMAVQADIERLTAWACGEWTYVRLYAKLLNLDGNPTGIAISTGGIESDADMRPHEQALSQALHVRYGSAYQVTVGATTHQIRARSDRPFDKKVYAKIMQTLIERGYLPAVARKSAVKYARRKGSKAAKMAAFEREMPLDLSKRSG